MFAVVHASVPSRSSHRQLRCGRSSYCTLVCTVSVSLTLCSLCPHCCSLRQEEVHAISGPDEFGEFYRRLKHLKEYHRRYPNEVEVPMAMEFLRLDEQRKKPPEEMQSMAS